MDQKPAIKHIPKVPVKRVYTRQQQAAMYFARKRRRARARAAS